jgi:hypothetical protein
VSGVESGTAASRAGSAPTGADVVAVVVPPAGGLVSPPALPPVLPPNGLGGRLVVAVLPPVDGGLPSTGGGGTGASTVLASTSYIVTLGVGPNDNGCELQLHSTRSMPAPSNNQRVTPHVTRAAWPRLARDRQLLEDWNIIMRS